LKEVCLSDQIHNNRTMPIAPKLLWKRLSACYQRIE